MKKQLTTLMLSLLLGSGLLLGLNSKPANASAGSWSVTGGTAGGTARSEQSSVIYGDKIYSWAGNTDEVFLNSLSIYDISDNAWSSSTSGGTPRSSQVGVLNGSKIYFWGGWVTSGQSIAVTNTMDIYDIALNSWSTGLAGGTARAGHAGVVFNGNIYYWGGCTASNGACDVRLNTMDIYNIAGNSWTTGTTGGTARTGTVATTDGVTIYFWGGNDTNGTFLSTMDKYSIAGNSWTTGATGGTARDGHVGVLYAGYIYYWGGENSNNALQNGVDIYNITGDSWSLGTAGGVARHGASAVEYGGKIYIWGGSAAGTPSWVDSNKMDIYDTGYHPLPVFQTLPDDTRTINLDAGQTVTTNPYVLRVMPTSVNNISKVEFSVDGTLICTDTTADEAGVYTCSWNTALYDSTISVKAYDDYNYSTTLTTWATVSLGGAEPGTEIPVTLPETGADL